LPAQHGRRYIGRKAPGDTRRRFHLDRYGTRMKDHTRQRMQLGIIAVLLLVIAGMVYQFIVVGSVEKAKDGRAAILLEPGERALVLAEMRGLVAGLQQMTDALARDDMKSAAATAHQMGMAAAHSAPAPMVGKLPLEFKTLGFSLHREFDTIAMDAEGLGDPKHTLKQLAGALQKCVACRSTYQIKAASGQ
jgi:hypothetical protein